MFNPFKAMGDMNQMRKQAMAIQQALEGQEFTITEGNVKVVINGNQSVKLVEVDGVANEPLKRAFNSAIRQSQQAAAAKLAELSKSMNM
jgi:DNA-binding protein YbaB